MSQEQLAELAGMSPGNLSLLERGEINYTQPTLEALADALDCSVVDLLTRDPKQPGEIFGLWEKATIRQRRQLDQIASTILKTGDD